MALVAKVCSEELRKTERGKEIYAMRKETIERVFGDAKEKHAMRYTQHRGLAQATNWVRLKFAAMNLKKLAVRAWETSAFYALFSPFAPHRTTCYAHHHKHKGIVEGNRLTIWQNKGRGP